MISVLTFVVKAIAWFAAFIIADKLVRNLTKNWKFNPRYPRSR